MPTENKLEYFDYNKIPDAPFYNVEIDDPEYGLKGWVVIHSMGANGACGGVRLYPDVNLEEVNLLARAMTYKYCFFERDTGGAKAGLQMPFDLPPEERRKRLRSFGAHISSLLRASIYMPWTDMNSRLSDLQCILEGAGMPTGSAGDSAYYTALSTFAGVMGAAEFYGLKPEDCRITIEGVGNVGYYLAREIGSWGGKIIGASTLRGAVANPDGLDIEELLKLRDKYDDEWVNQKGKWEVIKHRELFALPMNIHVPCARVHSHTEEIAGLINARAVVPAANVPCTPEGEKRLNEKGIKLLPDFIINGGGIVGTGIGELGASEKKVAGIFTSDFKDMIVRLLRQSEEKGKTAVELAAAESHKNFKELYFSAMTTPGLSRKLYQALEWRGLIPNSIRKKRAAGKLLKIMNERFR